MITWEVIIFNGDIIKKGRGETSKHRQFTKLDVLFKESYLSIRHKFNESSERWDE